MHVYVSTYLYLCAEHACKSIYLFVCVLQVHDTVFKGVEWSCHGATSCISDSCSQNMGSIYSLACCARPQWKYFENVLNIQFDFSF